MTVACKFPSMRLPEPFDPTPGYRTPEPATAEVSAWYMPPAAERFREWLESKADAHAWPYPTTGIAKMACLFLRVG
jgi:hypothetical protein